MLYSVMMLNGASPQMINHGHPDRNPKIYTCLDMEERKLDN